jgi:hypothetical protein
MPFLLPCRFIEHDSSGQLTFVGLAVGQGIQDSWWSGPSLEKLDEVNVHVEHILYAKKQVCYKRRCGTVEKQGTFVVFADG